MAPLTERLVLAVLGALTPDDPLITIELGDNRLNVSWPDVKSSPDDNFRCGEGEEHEGSWAMTTETNRLQVTVSVNTDGEGVPQDWLNHPDWKLLKDDSEMVDDPFILDAFPPEQIAALRHLLFNI